MGVDVVDRLLDPGQRLLHAAHATFAAGRDHVVAVGGGAIADDLGMDARAPRQRMIQRLDHHHAAAGRDDEAVAACVVGPRGLFRAVVVLAGEGAHGVEQVALAPVFFFAAPGEDDVLVAHADLLHGLADAVRAAGAGGGDGIAEALDAERRGQAGGNRVAHGARHAERADAGDALLAQDVHGLHLVERRGAAGAGDQAGARVGNLRVVQPGILDRLLQGQVGIGRGVAHEALDLAVDVQRIHVQRHRAAHLAAHADFGVGRVEADARTTLAQMAGHAFQVIAEAGNQPHSGDHDAAHVQIPFQTVGRAGSSCGRRRRMHSGRSLRTPSGQ